MNRAEFRAWLGGLLEGFAAGDIAPATLDRLVSKIEANAPGRGDAAKQSAPEPRPADYGDYDGPGAPPSEEDAAGGQAMTLEDIQKLKDASGKAKKVPKARRGAAAGAVENTTPAAPQPPYNPNDPQVVRME